MLGMESQYNLVLPSSVQGSLLQIVVVKVVFSGGLHSTNCLRQLNLLPSQDWGNLEVSLTTTNRHRERERERE